MTTQEATTAIAAAAKLPSAEALSELVRLCAETRRAASVDWLSVDAQLAHGMVSGALVFARRASTNR